MAAGLPLPEVAAYSGHSVGGLALDAVGEYLAQLLTAAP
jgi:hypothetical protein